MQDSLSLSTKERIAELEDANRPLEIHWNVKAKFGLDARDSENKYKHHISSLEEIYCKEKGEQPPPPRMLVTTPVTELYGTKGLLSTLPGIEEKKKKREGAWVSNFQKYSYLKDPSMTDPTMFAAPRTKSPSKTCHSSSADQLHGATTVGGGGADANTDRKRHRHVSGNFGSNDSMEHGIENDSTTARNVRRRSYNTELTEEELVMLGVYRLNPRQAEIYDKFVTMLADFDSHDMRNIAEDALKDARNDELLDYYGGTEIPAD